MSNGDTVLVIGSAGFIDIRLRNRLQAAVQRVNSLGIYFTGLVRNGAGGTVS